MSIVDFMKIWRHYDADKSGYIETEDKEDGSNEFRDFVTDFLKVKKYTSITNRNYRSRNRSGIIAPTQENFREGLCARSTFFCSPSFMSILRSEIL